MNLIQIYVKDDATNFQEIVPYVGAYGEGNIRVRLITQFTGETSWFAKFKKPNSLKTTNLLMIDTGLTEQVEVSPGVFENWKAFERTVDGNVFDIDSAVSQNVKGSFDYWFVSSDGLGIVVLSTDLFNVFPSALVSEYARVADTATDWVYQDVVNATTILTGNSIKITTVGTTDYTLIGAPNNNVGTIFVATGVPTGTGTAEVWVDSEVELAEDVTRVPTELYDIPVDPNFEAQSSQPLTNEEVIIDTLNGKLSKQEAIDNYVNQDVSIYPEQTTVKSTDLVPINDGDTGNMKHAKLSEIITDVGSTFESITLLDGTGNNAVGTYDGKDVRWLIQPEGTQETVSAEMFKNLFVQVQCSADINSGDFVQFDGVIGVSGKVKGKPFVPSELSASPFLILGVATQSGTALGNQEVLVNWYGIVNDLDTSLVAEEEILYAKTDGTDGVDNGKWTNVAPVAPKAQIRVAAVLTSHATQGALLVRPDFGVALGDLHDVYLNGGRIDGATIVFNSTTQRYEQLHLANSFAPHDIISGTVRNTFDLLYDSSQSDMRLTMKSGATIAEIHWSDRVEELDVTDYRFTPNFGADTAPTANFMYLTKGATSNDPAVANTNSSYPSEEYIPIAELSFFTEVTTNGETPPGPVRNQNINNHQINDDLQGGYAIVTEYLRDLGVLYLDGLDGTGNLGTGSLQYIEDDSGTYYIKISTGTCRQYNKQNVSATDTTVAGGDDMHVFNDVTTPYVRITNLNQITNDSTGALISNNRYFNVVLNRVVNKTGEYCTLLISLPSGTYGDETDAINDIERYTETNVPSDFKKVSQPLITITLKKVATGAGLQHVLTTDNRNSKTAGGGGGGGVNDTSFFANQFEIKDPTNLTKKIEFGVSGVSTATKRTLSAQDKDYVIADKADLDNHLASFTPHKLEDLENTRELEYGFEIDVNGNLNLILKEII